MNWGKKITLVYISFVALMITMVTMAMKQRLDLVSDDYYLEELKYQDRIDRITATNQLNSRVIMELESENIKISFPQELEGKISGKIHLYCASDARNDKIFDFETQNNSHLISKEGIQKGSYTLKLEFNSGSNEYYTEETITIK